MDLSKFDEIIVDRKGYTIDSNMTTKSIIDEINPSCTYVISVNGLEKIDANITEYNSYSSIPDYFEFDGEWLSNVNINYNTIINSPNILGEMVKFEIDLDAFQIPIQEATENNLQYYGCRLYKINDVIKFETEDTLPLCIINVGKNYIKDYILQEQFGGGVYLEYHKNPHFHMPINDSASGGIVLAKKNGDTYHISCFKIPFGFATYIPPFVIHNDCFLIGDYYVIYSKSEPFSTSLLRNKDNKIINVGVI
jgi:hypothetical protein